MMRHELDLRLGLPALRDVLVRPDRAAVRQWLMRHGDDATVGQFVDGIPGFAHRHGREPRGHEVLVVLEGVTRGDAMLQNGSQRGSRERKLGCEPVDFGVTPVGR